MRTTDNYSEYKQHHLQLCKMCGVPTHSSIAPVPLFEKGNKVVIRFYTEKNKATIPQGSKLYHTSKTNNIKRLTGTWKSSDGVLYSSMRVYFYIGNAGNRLGGSSSGSEHVYEFTGNVNNVFIDPELGGKAVFIETNTSIPVTQIK